MALRRRQKAVGADVRGTFALGNVVAVWEGRCGRPKCVAVLVRVWK